MGINKAKEGGGGEERGGTSARKRKEELGENRAGVNSPILNCSITVFI